uniref:Lymphocyte cytosolic protein 2 n=1 Tax=Capra hircus TaxID=9925 RepID=A0A452FFN2_CAPHI
MAFKNVPFRSEVLNWDPDALADYFKKLNYKDCEKVVKKHHIDGPRFLSLAENDIQKFPKLRVPILSKLSQEINKNEERRSIFTRKPQVQRFPEETESHEEDNGGWSSFVSMGRAPPAQGRARRSLVVRHWHNAGGARPWRSPAGLQRALWWSERDSGFAVLRVAGLARPSCPRAREQWWRTPAGKAWREPLGDRRWWRAGLS